MTDLAQRYGHEDAVAGGPEQESRAAVKAQDWAEAKQSVECLSDAGAGQKMPG